MSRRLIYVLTILALLFGMVGFQPVKPVQAANNLRISQVSGDAGAPDSIYKDKFIELFNAGNASASLAGLSLQYADNENFDLGNVGSFHVAPLPDKSIAPGGYFLIKVVSFDTDKPPIPAADYDLSQLQTYRIIDNAYGKLALVSGIEPLNCSSTGNPCGQEQLDRIIDRVAYGGLNFYEGDNPGPLAGVGLSIQRKDAGCQDTDQNGEDLIIKPPIPRNSASPSHSCQPMGDPADLRLSQVYGGGGNSGATYTHDFIEIFNAGIASVSLDGLSLQYASATGTGNFGASAAQLTELPNVTLEAGQYFLVEQASGTNGVALPTPDYIDPTPIGMSATNGKVALVTGTTTLGCNGGSTPCNADQTARIIDLVGFGNANFYEGTQAAPVLSSTLSAQRKQGGCQDTNQNGDDFTAETPAARNTASPTHSCGPVVYPERFIISEYIEGSGQNKAIELYNGTGAAIDLSGYRIDYYNSSVGTVTQTLALTGTLENEDVYVIVTDQSDQAMKDVADLVLAYPSVVHFNGDDSLVLVRVADGAVQDSFGDIDNDPGAYWGDETVKTQDQTLVRKAYVCQGDTTPDDDFVPALQYDPHPIDTFTHLGSHTMDCSITPPTAPTVQSIAPANNAVVPGTTDIVVTFSENVTVAEGWYDITCTQSGAHTAFVTDANPVFTLNPDTDFTVGETCTVTIDKDKVTNAANEAMAENYVSSFSIVEGCGDAFTAIYAIQGEGAASPVVNEIVTTEGVVTANFQVGGKKGYTIQDPEGDNNPATSDGIFVYSISPEINVGDRLRITGKVTEYFNMTQLTPTSAATVLTCSIGNVITPTEITLPVAAPRDYERYEGMLVTFPQALFLAEYFNFDRYGEIVLSGARHNTPTSVVEPGDEAVAAEQAYILDSIKVDDTLTSQNPPYLRHPDGSQFTKEHYFRGGDTIKGLTGIMDYNFNEWKIQPVGEATFAQMNLRPEAPSLAPGEIRIASMNVLNYFVTLDNAGNICGPGGNVNCRGADTPEEFERQHTKIVKAIVGMEADVIGLMEIENEHPAMEADGAVKHLVAALNAETADGTYDYVATGNIGTDAIKQAFIYKPAKVDRVGNFAILDENFDEAYDTTRNRPSLAVSFKDKITDEIFTVSVNHFKSKGSACEGDPDLGDGQGDCNLTRKRAAEVLVSWLEDDPTEANSDMYVIIGDLNSYAKEDPIDAIKLGADKTAGTADDVTNLVEEFNEPEAYGYVFDGKAGYLDHALANKKFAYYVLDAKFWHINADEADVFDYDNSFKPAEQAALYSPDAYRSSDHDPILISLILNHAPVANDDEYSTNMGVTLEVPAPGVLANDTDANEDDIITATLVEGSGPANGELVFNPDGSFTYTPNPNFVGTDTFEYTMHATPGLMDNYSDTATVTINVEAGVGFKDGGAIYIAQSRPDGRHLLGVSGDFTVQGMVLNEAQSLEMKLYAGTEEEPQLLQTNTIKSMDVFGPTATTFTSSFDIFGVYTSSSWDNVKETEYGQTVPATHVVATVTMPNGYTFSRTAWITNERDIIIRGDIAPQDFGYAAFSGVKGVSAGFEITDMGNLRGAQSLVVKLYSGEETDLQLLQTNTAVLDGGQFDNFLQFSTPFDIFGDFNYEADGYWTNVREPEYGQTVEPTCVEATVTFLNGTTKTARNCNRTGDRRWIVSTLDEEIRTAPEYGYPDGYEYGGDFEFNDDENIYTVTYKPAQVLAGKPTADIARYLGALYRQDGATINGITFNGVDYTWKFDPLSVPELKGSNWRDADNKTLVSAIAAYMASPDYDPAAGFTLTVTDGYNTETVTFIVIITNTLDAEIGSGFDYEYDPAYTYVGSRVFDDANNVYTVTYKETEIAPHAMNDLARYLGALHRQDDATIIAIAYKGTTYTWNAEGTLLGSNWEDAEGNTLVSVITADFLGGAIDPTVGIVLTVADGIHTETVTFKMIITNVAPVLDPIADETIPELVEYTFTATASDVPTATLTFSLVGAPEGAVIDATTGVFTWRPTEAQGPGEYTFTVKVCDDATPSLCDQQQVTLAVEEVNLAPEIEAIEDQEVTAGEELTFTAVATDPDLPANTLTFRLEDAPTGATIDATTGKFTWTPTVEQVGEHEIELCVSDGELEDCQTFKVTVLPLNQAPIAVEDAYEVAQDGVLSVAAPGVLENDSDPEDAELTAELVTTTQFGTLILNPNGSFIYVPNEGYAGVDSFTYKAFDGELYSEEVTVTITVMAPPVWGMFFPIILN